MATKKPKRTAGSKKPAPVNMGALFFIHLGKLALDSAKLSFAGIVIGGIMRVGIPEQTLISTGAIVSGIMALFGIICLMLCKEK